MTPGARDIERHLEHAAGRLRRVLEHDEALARLSDRDELRALVDEARAATRDFEALLDWADESELPPGLRDALDSPGVHEISFHRTTGAAATAGPSPLEAGEPLRALVHTAEMGESYDRTRLDIVDLGVGEDYDPDDAEHVVRSYRFRIRAFAEQLDDDLGPLEHASLYLDAAGVRRATAVLRRRLAAAERADQR